LPGSHILEDRLSKRVDGADHGEGSGRLECMSGRQLARTGGGGRNSKPWDIQQADKSIRVRNAGERLLPRPRFSATTSLVGLSHRPCVVNFQTMCGMPVWLAGGRGSGPLPSVPHAPFVEKEQNQDGEPRAEMRTGAMTHDSFLVIAGLDPAIPLRRAVHSLTHCVPKRDGRVIGERSDAVLRTALPGHDGEC
jgi:hypothetical protein